MPLIYDGLSKTSESSTMVTYIDATSAPLKNTGVIRLYDAEAFDGMRKACQLTARCLDELYPLVKPGVIAGSILVFIPSLGAYVIPRVLGGGKNMMLGNLIEMQFGSGRNWPLGAAMSITLMAFVMIALIFYVRNASRGGAGHV